MLKRYRIFLLRLISVLLLFGFSAVSFAQQAVYVGEDDVSSVFASGGYGALFGAAMGAAVLPFMSNSPMQNLRVVAGGASIGFIFGSAYGFYSLANANKNSYFNYTSQEEDNGNFYYSMPPTLPTHGAIRSKKNHGKMMASRASRIVTKDALFVGSLNNLSISMPDIFISTKAMAFKLLNVSF